MTDIRLKTSVFIQGIPVRYGSHADVLDVLLHVKYRHICELMCYINRYKYIADKSVSNQISFIVLDKTYYLEVVIFFYLNVFRVQYCFDINSHEFIC